MKILTVLRGLIGLVTSNSRLLLLLILLNLCLSESEARGKTIFIIYFFKTEQSFAQSSTFHFYIYEDIFIKKDLYSL